MDDALADAAWLTGLERNSDLVVMQCYAPLLVNENPGARQWRPDLIGYDTLAAYGSPSSYAQSMFSTHLGDHIIPVVAPGRPAHLLLRSLPRRRDCLSQNRKHLFQFPPLRISLPSAHLLPVAQSTLLAASTQYLPVTSILTNVSNPFTRPFPPQSITVLQLETH